MKTWKRISTVKVIANKWLKVFVDQVILPSGQKTNYIYYSRNGRSTDIICLNSKKQVLLTKEYSYLLNKKIFQFPGGYLNREEGLFAGANRELGEEVGLKANQFDILGKYICDHRRNQTKIFVLLARGLTEQQLTPDLEEEGIELSWYSIAEIDQLIEKGAIINSDVLGSWLLFKLRYPKLS